MLILLILNLLLKLLLILLIFLIFYNFIYNYRMEMRLKYYSIFSISFKGLFVVNFIIDLSSLFSHSPFL